MPVALNGHWALVTGASRGLGKEIAMALAAAGARVALTARSEADLRGVEQEIEGRVGSAASARTFPADLSAEAGVRTLGASLSAAGVEPDMLVAAAATQGPIGPFLENDWQEWVGSIRLNAFAPLLLSRWVLPSMQRKGWGKILFLSGGGATGPRPRFTAYAAAKTLLVRFTESLAAELRDTGVDVNAVAPGAMKSAMTEAVIAAGPARAGEKEYQAARLLEGGTEAVVSRAAALCVFLCSHASDGITGKLISAAWDPWETLEERREELASTDVYTLRRIVPSDRGLDWGSR